MLWNHQIYVFSNFVEYLYPTCHPQNEKLCKITLQLRSLPTCKIKITDFQKLVFLQIGLHCAKLLHISPTDSLLAVWFKFFGGSGAPNTSYQLAINAPEPNELSHGTHRSRIIPKSEAKSTLASTSSTKIRSQHHEPRQVYYWSKVYKLCFFHATHQARGRNFFF